MNARRRFRTSRLAGTPRGATTRVPGSRRCSEPMTAPFARAFRAIGNLGRRDLLPGLRAEVYARGEEASPWALWSLVLFGEKSAVSLLWKVAEEAGPVAAHACALAACASEASECATRLLAMVRQGEWHTALAGAEARGDPACVPWVLDTIETQPEAARRAAWVYATLTGACLTPPLATRMPTNNPTDAAVAHRIADPYEDLPAPQPDALREHWRRVGSNFWAGERWLGGRRIEPVSLSEHLRTGAQPWRAHAAIELARTSASGGVFPVRSPGFLQAARLASPAVD